MNFDLDFYRNFFTFNYLGINRKFVQILPFHSLSNISHDILIGDSNELNIYVIKEGTIWPDLIFTGWPGLLVVSKRVRDIFVNEGTSINFLPVNILDKQLNDLNVNYYRVQVLGKSGPLQKELSREEIATRVPGGPQFIKKIGLYFKPGSWDGSDFFTPENTTHIFITSKIKELLSSHGVSNVKMEPIIDVEAFFV